MLLCNQPPPLLFFPPLHTIEERREHLLTPPQPNLGPPPRAPNHHPLRPPRRLRSLQIPHRPKHNPIPLRRPHRPLLPLSLAPRQLPYPRHLPNPRDNSPASGSGLDGVPGESVWVCEFSAYRLHHLHPCEIMQTPPGYVSARHPIWETLPLVQIPRRPHRHRRRRSLHPARLFGQETRLQDLLLLRRAEQSMGLAHAGG